MSAIDIVVTILHIVQTLKPDQLIALLLLVFVVFVLCAFWVLLKQHWSTNKVLLSHILKPRKGKK